MTTTGLVKGQLEPTWTLTKVQEETASALTGHMLITSRVLQNADPKTLRLIRKEWADLRIEYFRSLGVKTPLDLVRAWTEYDTNMFGSSMRFWGDEKQAHVEYDYCGCWSALDKLNTTGQEQELMIDGWSELSGLIAGAFGFVGEEKLGCEPDEAGCTITFSIV